MLVEIALILNAAHESLQLNGHIIPLVVFGTALKQWHLIHTLLAQLIQLSDLRKPQADGQLLSDPVNALIAPLEGPLLFMRSLVVVSLFLTLFRKVSSVDRTRPLQVN